MLTVYDETDNKIQLTRKISLGQKLVLFFEVTID